MAKLLGARRAAGQVLGKADAPVDASTYASMTCPHCAHFHEATLPELKTKYIDTGKARLILREFPFDPRAEAGFMLARCSNDNYFADGRRAVQAAGKLGRRRRMPRMRCCRSQVWPVFHRSPSRPA